MNPETAGNYLEQLARGVNSALAVAFNGVLGGMAQQTIAGAFTLADLLAVGTVVLLLLALSAPILVVLRRYAEQAKTAETPVWQSQLALAASKPFWLIFWVYGAYLALTPLLLQLASRNELAGLRLGLSRLVDTGVFAAIFWLFFRFTRLLEQQLTKWAARTESKLDDLFVPLLCRSLRVILPVIGIIFALPLLGLPPEFNGLAAKGTSILLIVAVGLIAIQAVHLGEKAVVARYDITAADNLQARKIFTQVHIISKTLYVLIVIFAVASVLMLFDEVRRFGTSILASAGVVGIIFGFAAQKTISNLFAGFQIAMTQPMRLFDVVIVENEWGTIEEITLTYVIVRIWDERRLVVPLSYFIERPFQNWTRTSAALMGSVFLWTDYSLPLEEIRAQLRQIIEQHPLWDKRFWNLQVTDSNDRAMQLRVLATSADSSKSWDLRCDIREKLISYIQEKHPRSLPRFRAQIEDSNAASHHRVGGAP